MGDGDRSWPTRSRVSRVLETAHRLLPSLHAGRQLVNRRFFLLRIRRRPFGPLPKIVESRMDIGTEFDTLASVNWVPAASLLSLCIEILDRNFLARPCFSAPNRLDAVIEATM